MLLWDRLFQEVSRNNPEVINITNDGMSILRYQCIQDEGIMKGSFDANIKGYRCLCVNALGTGSKTFRSKWNRETYDIMLSFGFRGGRWYVSLYSDKPEVDCAEIAKTEGGGGHKGAAGWNVSRLSHLPTELTAGMV
jgi:hypothetical protein